MPLSFPFNLDNLANVTAFDTDEIHPPQRGSSQYQEQLDDMFQRKHEGDDVSSYWGIDGYPGRTDENGTNQPHRHENWMQELFSDFSDMKRGSSRANVPASMRNRRVIYPTPPPAKSAPLNTSALLQATGASQRPAPPASAPSGTIMAPARQNRAVVYPASNPRLAPSMAPRPKPLPPRRPLMPTASAGAASPRPAPLLPSTAAVAAPLRNRRVVYTNATA